MKLRKLIMMELHPLKKTLTICTDYARFDHLLSRKAEGWALRSLGNLRFQIRTLKVPIPTGGKPLRDERIVHTTFQISPLS
jgi:hypothetical protein